MEDIILEKYQSLKRQLSEAEQDLLKTIKLKQIDPGIRVRAKFRSIRKGLEEIARDTRNFSNHHKN